MKVEDINSSCLISPDNISGIGNVEDKKGYQKAVINIERLKDALELFEKYKVQNDKGERENVMFFVKTGEVTQIGTQNVGILIAPIIDDNDQLVKIGTKETE